jgi:membrane-associated phospholipid phosphatase
MKRNTIIFLFGLSIGWFLLIGLSIAYWDIPAALHASELMARHPQLAFIQYYALLGKGKYCISALLLLYVAMRFLLRNNTWTRKALYLLSSGVFSGLLVDIFKLFCGRPRPKLFLTEDITQWMFWHHRPFSPQLFTSFPSGHATMAAAIGMAIALLCPRVRWLGILFALLMAVERVLTNWHYPADVMAGLYVGMVVSLWLYHSYYKTKRQMLGCAWLEGA